MTRIMMIMVMMRRRRTRWVNRTIISKKRWRHWYCPEWWFDCADGWWFLQCRSWLWRWLNMFTVCFCYPYIQLWFLSWWGNPWFHGTCLKRTMLTQFMLEQPLAWLLKLPVLQATSYLLTKPEAGLSTEQLICRWAPPEEYSHHWGSLDHYPLSMVEKERMVNGSNSSNDQQNESLKDPQGIIGKRPSMVSEDPNDLSIFFTARPTINAQRMWSAAARVHPTNRQRVWSTFP